MHIYCISQWDKPTEKSKLLAVFQKLYLRPCGGQLLYWYLEAHALTCHSIFEAHFENGSESSGGCKARCFATDATRLQAVLRWDKQDPIQFFTLKTQLGVKCCFTLYVCICHILFP